MYGITAQSALESASPARKGPQLYTIEIALTAFPIPYRFSVGWYARRVYGVLSGSLVLLILIKEVTMLYGELRAVLAQRREREARLLTGTPSRLPLHRRSSSHCRR